MRNQYIWHPRLAAPQTLQKPLMARIVAGLFLVFMASQWDFYRRDSDSNSASAGTARPGIALENV
jgi:hypothetical protein